MSDSFPDETAAVPPSIAANQIRSDALRLMLEYWLEKKERLDRIPARADLAPEEMKPFLPFVSLIAVRKDSPKFQFRLVGTGITGAFGNETTGHEADEALFGKNADAVSRFFSLPVQTGGPAYATGRYTVAPDYVRLDFETVLLPLSSSVGVIDMLLGGLVGQRLHRDQQAISFAYDYFCPIR